MKEKEIFEIENLIDYRFKDKSKLVTAFAHKSYVNECMIKKTESYERYEFLGDAILEYIVSEYLFSEYSELPEGELTKLRASLVCEFTLSKICRDNKLGQYILLSKGEYKTGGANRDSILCDIFESILGAIYIDGGMECAQKYVRRFLLTDIEHKQLYYDSKTRLQEYVQKNNGTYRYDLISETGPDHNKEYRVCLIINDKKVSEGTGHNKKSAEQDAAYNALKIMR